jgi:methionyl-tRNA formyltransferase
MSKKAMIAAIPKKQKDIKILFFGRTDCEGSEKLLNQILRDGLDVTYIRSHERGEKLPEDIHEWVGDYIICFRTLFILPEALIKKAKIAAINFHPGPPEYPGSGCINFALYDEVSDFGVTAHLMSKKVDNGKILEVRRFPIQKSENLFSVLERTHNELYSLCSDFIAALSSQGKSFIKLKLAECADVNWVGEARFIKELDKLQIIDEGITKEELERIIRATYIDGFPPKIRVHGYNFSLSLEDEITEIKSKT